MGAGKKIGEALGAVIVWALEWAVMAIGTASRASAEAVRQSLEPGEWEGGKHTVTGIPFRERKSNSFGGKETYYDTSSFRMSAKSASAEKAAEAKREAYRKFVSAASLLASEWDRTHYLYIAPNGDITVSGKDLNLLKSYVVLPTGESEDAAKRALLAAFAHLSKKKAAKEKKPSAG